MDKHSCLLRKLVNCGRKKIIGLAPFIQYYQDCVTLQLSNVGKWFAGIKFGMPRRKAFVGAAS
jgi:hypothetical protein